MKKVLIFTLLMSLSQFVAASESSLFEGNFECSGIELDTTESFKIMLNIEKTGKTYALTSKSEEDSYVGTGIYDSTNKSLAAAFINHLDSKETGIIILHARKNKLDATWTYLGKKTIAQASCTKVR